MYSENSKVNSQISFWLILMFWIIAIMIVVGGLTRLTDSGLSITQWQLFSGFLPPLNNADWEMYFNLYKDLMVFWKEKFDNYIFDLSYEELINNQKEVTQKLLNFCELSWDENCLNPHKNKKTVSTASLAQVRSPIYKTSVKKWKKYEEELTELKKLIL